MKPGQKVSLKETFLVMLVSAFWHGFYPFYYVMFFNAAIFVETAKELYRARALFKWIPDNVAWLIGNQGMLFICSYFGVSFNQLTFSRGLIFAKATYFIVWIINPLLLVILKLGGFAKMAKKIEAEEKSKSDKKDK